MSNLTPGFGPPIKADSFLSVFAPVLPRSWPTFAFVPNNPDRFVGIAKSAIHPRQMVGNGFSRTRTIRFRVHPHPDFHRARFELRSSILLGKAEIPGLTPIVRRGRMRLYAPDDCSIVITSVRRVSSRQAGRTQSDNSRIRSGGEDSTTSRQRLEPAEREYARTGRLPFPRRLRQRVVLG
jgi:hypothetical protein